MMLSSGVEYVTEEEMKYLRGTLPITHHAVCWLKEERDLVVFPTFDVRIAKMIKDQKLRRSIKTVGSVEFGEVDPAVKNPQRWGDFSIIAQNRFYDIEIHVLPSEDPQFKGRNHVRFISPGKYDSLGEVTVEINFSNTTDKSVLKTKNGKVFELECKYDEMCTHYSGPFPPIEMTSLKKPASK